MDCVIYTKQDAKSLVPVSKNIFIDTGSVKIKILETDKLFKRHLICDLVLKCYKFDDFTDIF